MINYSDMMRFDASDLEKEVLHNEEVNENW